MEMICLACHCKFIWNMKPFYEYPYCPECGSGRTGWYDEKGELHRNN